MLPTLARWLVGGIVALVLLTPSDAHARGIVIVTWGDTIAPLGRGETLPRTKPTAPLPAGYRPSGPTVSVNIGYKYQYFGVFWINVWTAGGTYCEYEGDAYTPISSAEAARALGKSEADLTPPFAYRYPLGWFIFGPLLLLWAVVAVVGKVRRSNRTSLPNAGPDRRTKRAILVLVAVGLLAVAGGVWLVTQSGSSTPASGQAPAPPTPEQVAENEAAEFVKRQGGVYIRDESRPGKPVVEVYLDQSNIPDAELKNLAPLKSLTLLKLPRVTDNTAAELRKIGLLYAIGPAMRDDYQRPRSADEVTRFAIHLTQMTAAGVKELAAFPNLNNFSLEQEKVTDDMLAALREVNLLHALCYARCGVGWRPKRAEDVTHVSLSSSKVTDAGLKHLASLPNLIFLEVPYTRITDAGERELQSLLPNCKIFKY